MTQTALIVGCGYLGRRVAALWQDAGVDVYAVTRSEPRAAEFQASGLHPIVADVTQPDTLDKLPSVDTVLFAVGYDRRSDQQIETVYGDGVRHVIDSLPTNAVRFIYISSTGVYGPANGAWVNEDTTPNPLRAGGKASWQAEQRLSESPLAARSAILRLAGVYGPGRIPMIGQLQAGEPIAAPDKGWLNLIHVDDAADIVAAVDRWLAVQNASQSPHIFCVSDGAPVVRADYYREAALRLGAPAPRFMEPPVDSPAAARAASDKRVCNDKLVRAISVQLSYPTYREGLASILAEERS